MCRYLAIMAAALISAFMLAACDDAEQPAPPPRELTREAVGHFCGMIVADHPGPKAQVFLKRRAEPVWFTSVRDAVAFTMLPEEPKTIAAIYVSDMSMAPDWGAQTANSWVDARSVWYVIESSRMGGMGAPEAVPFSDKADAERFAAQYGGRLVRFEGITAEYVLSPAETPTEQNGGTQ